MAKLLDVLTSIRPEPRRVEVGGHTLEFHQLDIGDYMTIEKETGVDMTREMLRARQENPQEVFSSKLIAWIMYCSLKKGTGEFVEDLRRHREPLKPVSEIVTYGLKGQQLGEVLVWAISGVQPGEEGNAAAAGSTSPAQ